MNQEPKTKILYNPEDKGADIIDYPIEEAEIDPNTGLARWNSGDGRWITTGRTLQWSIKKGEYWEFPEYVANYLQGIYGFLATAPNKYADKATKAEGRSEDDI